MIIPSYNINDITYFFDFDDEGVQHSYPNTPPGYSDPQIIYNFHYSGFLKNTIYEKNYNWEVSPPWYIISGQNSAIVTCQLMPKFTKNRERIVTGARKIVYRDINYSELNLTMGKWKETLNLYYKQGPLWKIEGNKNPKITYSQATGKIEQKIETYTLIPQYDQSGYPPKNATDPNTYSFDIKNGKIIKFHGTNPPNGNPMIDVFWYETGPAYLSFYSNWKDETLKFPNTLDIYVS